MTMRRLWVLASQLPLDSPLRRALVGPEEYQWTPELRMAASIQEQLQYVAWVIGATNAHRFKNKKNPVPDPVPIPRPGIEAKKKREAKPGGLVFAAKGESDKPKLQKFFGRPKNTEG